MMRRRGNARLTLVGPDPSGDYDSVHAAEPAGLVPDQIPFAVHVTMAQIHQVADDAEIRARILDDVASVGADRTLIIRPGESDLIKRRANSLRETASALREIADQMIECQSDAERTT